jgi:hypothetical protein
MNERQKQIGHFGGQNDAGSNIRFLLVVFFSATVLQALGKKSLQ